MKQGQWLKRHEKLLPWVAGAGFAVSHIVIASNCTVPKEGRCSTCGGCVVALAAIVTWAIYKKRKGGEFYTENSTGNERALNNNYSDNPFVPEKMSGKAKGEMFDHSK